MRRNVRRSPLGTLVAIAAVLLLTSTFSRLSADLVPVSVLLAYSPAETYEHEVELENRRHNLALLNFRDQQRAVEAKFSKAMIDCANTPPEQNCAGKAAAAEMTGIKGIQKREVDENQLHLSKLDKLATYYAFGKHR